MPIFDRVSEPTVTLAYWAPVYVTVDVERREVTRIRVVTSGMQRGPRISGELDSREAAAVVDNAAGRRCLPPPELV